MKCKHCGQEMKERLNFDILKECRHVKDYDDLIGELCGKECPFHDICPHKVDDSVLVENACFFNYLRAWLFEEATDIKESEYGVVLPTGHEKKGKVKNENTNKRKSYGSRDKKGNRND